MAENIVINGETYNGVESVSMKNTAGDTVRFFPAGVPSTAVGYSQQNQVVTDYLAAANYSPDDYTTSIIMTYSYKETDYTKSHPVGLEVTVNVAGEITLADRFTSYAKESFAGVNEVVNAAPGSVAGWWNVAGGSITANGYIKPTGQVRMIKTTASNVRDLGGWPCDGGIVKYGKLFRGGELTADDAPVLVEQCGVRHDLDLRGEEADGITESPIGSAIHYTCPGYPWYTLNSASWKSILRTIFDAVAHNEPLIFHCAAGADRTGTVACIVEALLGVSQSNLDKDFELTTFAVHPNARRRTDANWKGLIEEINTYMGNTFRDKVANWACSIGFTANEINAFRQTMIDGNPAIINPVAVFTITNNLTNVTNSNNATSVQSGNGYAATITVIDGYELSSVKVTMGGVDITDNVVTGGKIQISTVTGNVVITATAKEISTAPTLKNFADPTSVEWLTGKRLGTSGVSDETNGSIVTNCIPVVKGDTITVEGLNICWLKSNATARVHYLDENKNVILDSNSGSYASPLVYSGLDGAFKYEGGNSYQGSYKWTHTVGTTGDGTSYVGYADKIAYIRFCGSLETTAENVLINVNSILEEEPDEPDTPAYTNLANPDSADWLTNKRLGSSGVSDETNGSIVTNYIPCKTGDVVRVSGLNVGWLKSSANARCHFLASDKSILGTSTVLADDLFEFTDNTNQQIAYEWIGTIGNGDSASYPTIAYIRFCGSLKTTAADVIITVNEEIT